MTEKRLIDANALRQTIESNIYWRLNDGAFLDAIDDAPTLDAVEVVRCEDCKNTCPGWNRIVCTTWGAVTEPNNFCSYGERKDNGKVSL